MITDDQFNQVLERLDRIGLGVGILASATEAGPYSPQLRAAIALARDVGASMESAIIGREKDGTARWGYKVLARNANGTHAGPAGYGETAAAAYLDYAARFAGRSC